MSDEEKNNKFENITLDGAKKTMQSIFNNITPEQFEELKKQAIENVKQNNMSAKEMLEKLGYFEASMPNADEIVYNFKSSDIEDYRYIAFNKIDKYIEVDDWTGCFKLSSKELQAINKQVEELGWNNE